MARFVPPSPAHNSSDAESWLFKKLTALTDEYVVLHSLGLIRHDHKSWSEIDFTIVGPEGVFLIEVKGGVIGREEGEWFTTTRSGRRESLGRGPFFQVGGAEAATRRFLEERLDWLHKAAMGYWVYAPDCRLEVNDLGANSECFFDAAQSQTDANHLVGRMRSFWSNRRGRTGWLNQQEVQKVVDELCAEIQPIASLRRKISDVSEKICTATLEQQAILEAAIDNPRLIVKGPAGSGKSTIAAQDARVHSGSGKSVLVCCQSAGVKRLFRQTFEKLERVHVVEMSELNQLVDSDLRFDVLIIDEAQDVLGDLSIKVLDQILNGGLAQGIWRIFLDPFQGSSMVELRSSIDELIAFHPLFLNMNRNVRTTAQIAVASSALAYIDRISGGIDGPEVEFIYSENGKDLEDLLCAVEALLSEDVHLDEIIVVTSDPLETSLLAPLAHKFVDFSSVGQGETRIRHASVSEIKGLESTAIVFAGMTSIKTMESRQDAYIACTRATTILKIIVPKFARQEIIDSFAALALRNPSN
jgi:hypothetical protein